MDIVIQPHCADPDCLICENGWVATTPEPYSVVRDIAYTIGVAVLVALPSLLLIYSYAHRS
ncbi:hypothetical protein [Streptomyces sp. RKCA744]|uniref:hypothetical protein n=1 Tax=Streptomyces sp. RKCA744 TaxID=2959340 RepID=UPI00209DD202|nr:hypothetical protein [Streptomyces sp. RKCA744]MCO8305688.1 hypothetical protein [Streptomyces sp. RKCA744]